MEQLASFLLQLASFLEQEASFLEHEASFLEQEASFLEHFASAGLLASFLAHLLLAPQDLVAGSAVAVLVATIVAARAAMVFRFMIFPLKGR